MAFQLEAQYVQMLRNLEAGYRLVALAGTSNVRCEIIDNYTGRKFAEATAGHELDACIEAIIKANTSDRPLTPAQMAQTIGLKDQEIMQLKQQLAALSRERQPQAAPPPATVPAAAAAPSGASGPTLVRPGQPETSNDAWNKLTIPDLNELAEDNNVDEYPRGGNKAEKIEALKAAGLQPV